jgi:hypothetical protein
MITIKKYHQFDGTTKLKGKHNCNYDYMSNIGEQIEKRQHIYEYWLGQSNTNENLLTAIKETATHPWY